MSRVHDILLKDLYTTVEKAQLGNIIKVPQAGTGVPLYFKITSDNPDKPKEFKESTEAEFVALKNESNNPGGTQKTKAADAAPVTKIVVPNAAITKSAKLSADTNLKHPYDNTYKRCLPIAAIMA